jgi:hypothetical protein
VGVRKFYAGKFLPKIPPDFATRSDTKRAPAIVPARLWISLLCATALLLCRSEAQLNPDEKGAILAAGSTPLGRRRSGPRAA